MLFTARLDTQTIFSDASGNGPEVSFEALLHKKCEAYRGEWEELVDPAYIGALSLSTRPRWFNSGTIPALAQAVKRG